MKVFLFVFSLISSTHLLAFDASDLDTSLDARVRGESKTNGNYNKGAADRRSFTASRFRLNLKANLKNDGNYIFFQPQFVKFWGQREVVPVDGAVSGTSQSSGALNDTNSDIHQAFINWQPVKSIWVKAGRQEMNYGEQLLVGAVGWDNIGRSFDAIKLVYKINEKHKVDVFRSKLVDENVNSASTGDFDFSGLYYSAQFEKFIKTVDLYLFDKADHRGSNDSNIYTFGVRLKDKIKNFDYRFEGNAQKGRKIGNDRKDANQFDLEVGYKVEKILTWFGVEYFQASKDFDQLFPTAHKWLGIADQFQRRNIKGYAFHTKTKYEKFTFKLDYHIFQRKKTSFAARGFTGNALGTVGNNKNIANEFDFTVWYQWDENIKLALGHAIVTPGTYLKNQNGAQKDNTQFGYAQILASF